MKLVAWFLLAISLVSTAAPAENIIRISAPIKAVAGAGAEDAWVPAESLHGEWRFDSLWNCSITPDDPELPLGAFVQYKVCDERLTRTSQPREYNTITHKYRNTGEVETHWRNGEVVTKTVAAGECRFDTNPSGIASFWPTGTTSDAEINFAWGGQLLGIYDGDTSYSSVEGTFMRGRFMEMDADGTTSLYATCKIDR